MTSIPNNWRIFHLVTSKGPNGNAKNLNGFNETPFDLCLPEEHDRWGRGDWEGVRLYVLPWMKSNGFNALQISPITRNIPGVIGTLGLDKGKMLAPNHAYHARNLAPSLSSIELEPHFGSKAELLRLIQDAHQLGIKMIGDIVPNHLGYDAPLTLEHPEFFYSADDILLAQIKGDKVREYVVDKAMMGDLPALNHEHYEVRRRLDLLWIYHINVGFDSFRIDALCHCAEWYQRYLIELSPLAGYPLLGDGFPLFAENYSGDIFVSKNGSHKELWSKGYGTTSHPWHFACQQEVALPRNFGNVQRIADMQRLLVENGAKSVGFVDNHDTDRAYTACLEAGNSEVAASERVHVMLTLLYGFISPPAVLYATDSLAQGHGVVSHTSCRVSWTPPSSTPTLTLLRRLNRARANSPALESGWYSERYVSNDSGVLAYIRGLNNETSVLVVANISDSSVNTESLIGGIQVGDQFGESTSLVDLTRQSNPGAFSVVNGHLCGVLPPRSAYLLSVD
jgi:glycosidase